MDIKFDKAIDVIKKNRIVLNKYGDEPVILKHDINGEFKKICPKEVMKTFNENYDGNNVYDVSDITKHLIEVEVANYKK